MNRVIFGLEKKGIFIRLRSTRLYHSILNQMVIACYDLVRWIADVFLYALSTMIIFMQKIYEQYCLDYIFLYIFSSKKLLKLSYENTSCMLKALYLTLSTEMNKITFKYSGSEAWMWRILLGCIYVKYICMP